MARKLSIATFLVVCFTLFNTLTLRSAVHAAGTVYTMVHFSSTKKTGVLYNLNEGTDIEKVDNFIKAMNESDVLGISDLDWGLSVTYSLVYKKAGMDRGDHKNVVVLIAEGYFDKGIFCCPAPFQSAASLRSVADIYAIMVGREPDYGTLVNITGLPTGTRVVDQWSYGRIITMLREVCVTNVTTTSTTTTTTTTPPSTTTHRTSDVKRARTLAPSAKNQKREKAPTSKNAMVPFNLQLVPGAGTSAMIIGLPIQRIWLPEKNVSGRLNSTQIKKFAIEFVPQYTVAVDATRFGIVAFSTNVYFEFAPRSGGNMTALQHALKDLPYEAGLTNTAGSLQAVAQLFDGSDRPFSERYVVAFTDGRHTKGPNPTPFAQVLRDKYNAQVYAFGVPGINGFLKPVDDQELLNVTGNADHTFILNAAAELEGYANTLARAIPCPCSGTTSTSSGTASSSSTSSGTASSSSTTTDPNAGVSFN